MATEEEKKEKLVKVLSLLVASLAIGIYELLGDSAYALMKTVGEKILEIMQKEMGLEISGEDPDDVLNELLRIWVDEIGMFEDAKVEATDNGWVITGNNCKGWNLTQMILKGGAKEPFTCPIMNSMSAALSKLGVKTHMKIEPVPSTKGTKFTLTRA
ncbi:MAG: hypothetical protein KAS65_11265 [Candidatus Aminicenantes bacterium]|nr:hypothetical protein [Candidatus Aminicenantes bacterium]